MKRLFHVPSSLVFYLVRLLVFFNFTSIIGKTEQRYIENSINRLSFHIIIALLINIIILPTNIKTSVNRKYRAKVEKLEKERK